MSRVLTLLLVVVTAILVAACGSDEADTSISQAPLAIDEEALKADDYVSTNAREFVVSGAVTASLPNDFAWLEGEERAEVIEKVVVKHMSLTANAVKRYFDELVRDENGGSAHEDEEWFTYFRADADDLGGVIDITADEVTFYMELELVGSSWLMSRVDPDAVGDRVFEIEVWDVHAASHRFEELQIAGSQSVDAFPKYDELFEDGIYDISVHFGGDYNKERLDIQTARWLVDTLLADGWTNTEVRSFEDLEIDSPPFRWDVEIEGQWVEARVYIYHSDMVTAEDEQLLADKMVTSLRKRDVVIYSGHSGEDAGFVLDYQPEFEIFDTQFAELPMASKYQIYVIDGCQSYRTYVDRLLENPAKTHDNLDILTTVNTTPFELGYQVLHEFIYWVTATDEDGRHYPLSWKALLEGINIEEWDSVHYGVHGVDADPKVNPHTGLDPLCQPCDSSLDCGAGGNHCIGFRDGAACGVACTADSACGDGFRCADLVDDPDAFHVPKQCVPRDYNCTPHQ